ncbi:MAG TPA: preprotein translocase subunit SecE [Alphaproteobacteria bacterium]|nr:preprotein translocase subunit SecE [Alphaproteobacteria bacterium]
MNPINFFKEVKQEGSKVTWATRKETTAITITVLILVVISSAFFFLADWLIYTVIGKILGY